jgi:hypothetical protein
MTVSEKLAATNGHNQPSLKVWNGEKLIELQYSFDFSIQFQRKSFHMIAR